MRPSCCWYHKGTNFQANHNRHVSWTMGVRVVADTTKVRIFKQITTPATDSNYNSSCCWYHKGTNFQANHNSWKVWTKISRVVADTTKVRIFKQITTRFEVPTPEIELLLIPQRYEFSSKSQHLDRLITEKSRCCWYHKGTNFQANHNKGDIITNPPYVVADTTKVRIFKQITTENERLNK